MKPTLHTEYMREQIPALVGDTFNRGKWLAGHIACPTQNTRHIVLLVTLEKKDLPKSYQYSDKFIDSGTFQWSSQNSTTQSSGKGQQLLNAADNGITIELFVRATKKTKGKATPFTYCGLLSVSTVTGDAPMQVQFDLLSALTEELLQKFS